MSNDKIVLINGESGLGKTRLAEKLCSYATDDDGFSIRGKFDQSAYGAANFRYSGITHAFAELCSQLDQREDDKEDILRAVSREIDINEGTFLCEAFPSLKRLLPHNDDETTSDPSKFTDFSMSSKNRSHRLNYLLKKFTSAVTSVGDPIVFLLDDVQVSVGIMGSNDGSLLYKLNIGVFTRYTVV
jgi:predicted ATPase